MVKVIAFGTFDILHPGHAFFLKKAKSLGDYLVVVIARDATVKAVKGRGPTNDEASRQAGVIGLGIANKVILGNFGDKYRVVRDERPKVIALGYDQWHFTENLGEAAPSARIVRLPAFKPNKFKSSKLRRA